jgi:hypothetical protein
LLSLPRVLLSPYHSKARHLCLPGSLKEIFHLDQAMAIHLLDLILTNSTEVLLSITETITEAMKETLHKATPFPSIIIVKAPCSMTISSPVAQKHLVRYVIELIILLLIAFTVWIMLFREGIYRHNWQPW